MGSATTPYDQPPFGQPPHDQLLVPRLLEGEALPARVRQLPEPPERLFLHGRLPDGPCIGVVGTRHPSAEALAFAERLSGLLAARGVAIVSGGAKGIDAAAHRGALAVGGATLVVAGSSLDFPFPAAHRGLYAEILARGGGYLSRFEVGAPPRRHHFLDRNAILVALCDALVLVEAPLKSGARNATRWARSLHRPCFVVPSPPWNERGRGCIVELQLGARPLGSAQEVLDWLAENRPGLSPEQAPPPPRSERAPSSPEDELRAAVLHAMASGARYADDVADTLGIGVPRVNHALLLLMLSGDIDQGPGGVLTRARR